MIFSIDKKVFEKFPTLFVALPIITGFDNSRSEKEALDFLRGVEANLRKEMALEAFWKDPRITSYLACFKGFGVDPDKFVPAHVALSVRVLEGKNLPDINPMVNLYNAMSIKYLTPFGGENMDSLFGDFSLKFASGGEQWIPIGGGKSKPAIAGELVWGDEHDLSTRALNWRQCDRTKMTRETKNGYFVMDGFEGVNRDNIQKAADEFVAVAVRLFGGEAKIYWLDKEHPVAEIPFVSKKLDKATLEEVKTKQKDHSKKKKNIDRSSDLPELFQFQTWEGDDTITFNLKQLILRAIRQLAESREVTGDKVSLKLDDVKIEHPKQESYGDYSTSIAMVLAGKLGMKPRDLAEKIVLELNKYIRQYQSRTSTADSLSHQDGQSIEKLAKTEPKQAGEMLESASVAGPGFVNMTIRKDYLITLLTGLLKTQQSVITTKIKGKKIAVEYTDPNPFKEFHLGHMYSNFIGESISRLFEACGAVVWRGDFYGDVGMHVCKSVWGMMYKMDEEKISLEHLEKLTLSERQQFLGRGYAMGVREYEENEANAEKIRDINYLIYVAAQDILQKKKGWKPIIDYRKYIHGKNNDFEEVYKVYEAGLRWSLEYFESIYKRLGTKFDGYYPESWVGEYGMELVEKGLKKGVLEKDDGAVIYKGGKEGLHTRVFVNKLGLPTYETKDLGLAFAKYQDFKYDLSINIFGKEIDEYYYVVKSALRQIDPELGKKAFHLAHGMVKLPEGKMSSRTGNVITFEGLMDKLKTEILLIMKDSELSKDEKEKVADAVGLSAVRYALLKSDIGVDVVFDLKKSVSFEGDSGPYLMYTYARCKSVINKSKVKSQKSKVDNYQLPTTNYQLNTEELSVLRTLYRFPEVVAESARTLSPHLLCSFLFDLAQKYNLFYNKHSILNLDNRQQTTDNKEKNNNQPLTTNHQPITDFRLALTAATSKILSSGLYLLGIETVERM